MRKYFPMLAFLGLLAGDVQPVAAGCLADYVGCNQRAAQEDNFWWRTVLAIDCEIELSRCLKDALKWW